MTALEHMTMEQLERLIDGRIDVRLTNLLGAFDVDESVLFADDAPDTRTWEEAKQDIEHDRWTPPPGAKSALQLSREDRER